MLSVYSLQIRQNYIKIVSKFFIMGNRFSLRAETVTNVESDLTLSKHLLNRLTQSNSPEEIDLTPYVPTDDAEWMEKLKCMDEAHSEAHGLTSEAFYQLLEKIERNVALDTAKCPTENLIRCLQNSTFPIKCRQVLDEFIDCVEAQRIDIIKEKIQKHEQNRK